jgi:hypothetical protein
MTNYANQTIMNSEQEEVFNRYFKEDRELYYCYRNGIHLSFEDYQVVRENDLVLEIESSNISIVMFKKVDLLHIRIF